MNEQNTVGALCVKIEALQKSVD